MGGAKEMIENVCLLQHNLGWYIPDIYAIADNLKFNKKVFQVLSFYSNEYVESWTEFCDDFQKNIIFDCMNLSGNCSTKILACYSCIFGDSVLYITPKK